MAKRNRRISKNNKEVTASEHIDDSLLPSSEEMAKLNELSPEFIPFIIESATIERNARVEINKELITMNKREQWLSHGLNYFAVICGLFIICLGMYISYLLIINKHFITGAIFSSAGLGYTIYLFLSIANKNKVHPPTV